MPDSSEEILQKVIALADELPVDPAAYASLSKSKRNALRTDLESVVARLGTIAEVLDFVRQPKHVFDPTDPRVIGRIVADTLLLQDKEPLSQVLSQSFYGAGVYAIYYRGGFKCYEPVAGRDHPVYVGKADPAALHAESAEAQGTRLHTRLKDHCRSITNASNLDLGDFDCRYLVVRSAWVETAEDLLIGLFKPVWNNETGVCYGFGKHGDSASTRKNERSPWDTIHPGRAWATSENNTPNKRSVADIYKAVANHFEEHPPKP
jgi:hypothetical protein